MRSSIIFTTALSLAAPLQARPPMEPVTANVTFGDLDLASRHGQRILARRIADALEQVCGSYANAPDPNDQQRISDCRTVASADAKRQLANSKTAVRVAVTGPR